MAISELREPIDVERATITRDDYNSEIQTWSLLAAVWAKVVERGGSQPVIADRPVMMVSYEVTIRNGLTVTSKDRIKWRGKTLAIDTVTPLPAKGLVVMRCMEAS